PLAQPGASLGYDVHLEPPAVDHHLEPTNSRGGPPWVGQVGPQDVVDAIGRFEASAGRLAGNEARPFSPAVECDEAYRAGFDHDRPDAGPRTGREANDDRALRRRRSTSPVIGRRFAIPGHSSAPGHRSTAASSAALAQAESSRSSWPPRPAARTSFLSRSP